MSLLNKLKSTIRKYNLISRKDTIVIGVSGGADSLALTLLLKSLSKELKLSLHIAHLDHGLRGSSSKQDADFVLRFAQKLNVPITLREVNAAQLKQKGSLEEIARGARLHFLFETARRCKTNTIALGHNLDDQAETVLMRLIRGSGLLGLSGILPKRTMGRFTIIRPLLEISRKEIERFLKIKRIKPRRDYTNAQEIYFRNRIRRRLIPELKKYNPNIKEVLAHTAENIALDYEYVLQEGIQQLHKLKSSGARSKVKLSLPKFLKLHPSLQNMILRLTYEQLKGDTRRLTYQHIKELKDLVFNRPLGSVVDLPSQISAIKNLRHLCIYRQA